MRVCQTASSVEKSSSKFLPSICISHHSVTRMWRCKQTQGGACFVIYSVTLCNCSTSNVFVKVLYQLLVAFLCFLKAKGLAGQMSALFVLIPWLNSWRLTLSTECLICICGKKLKKMDFVLLQFKTNCRASRSVFTLSAPFAASTNAVIVTPAPLKADVVPSTGMVITPNLGGVCFQLCLYYSHSLISFSPCSSGSKIWTG